MTLSQGLVLGEQQVRCPKDEAVAALQRAGGCVKLPTTLDQMLLTASSFPSLCSQSAGFGSEPALFLAYGIFTSLLWQPVTCLHPPETLLHVQAGLRVSFPAGGRDAGSGLRLLPRYRCFPRGMNHPKAFSELWLLDGGEL